MTEKMFFLQIQVGIAVLLILLIRLGIRKLPKIYSYLLWLLVFARLLFPVSLETRFGLIPSVSAGKVWLKEALGQVDSDMEETILTANKGLDVGQKDFDGKEPLKAENDIIFPDSAEDGDEGAVALPMTMEPFFLLFWAVGTVVILAYNGGALMLVRKQTEGAGLLWDNIYACSQVKTPFTLGLVHPRIYIPDTLASEERDYIICHERMHINRKDYLVKNLAFLLTAVYWFNPLVWVAFGFMERDMEMSCDEAVIREKGERIKRRYSQSLLNFAEGKCSAAVTPFAFGENSVKQRVKNVLSYKEARRWTLGFGVAAILAVTALLFTVREVPKGESRGQESGSQIPAASWGDGKYLAADFSVDQSSAQSALECWAKAFTGRDGDTLYQLAADKENYKQWDMVYERADGTYGFGYSSPWPQRYLSETDEQGAVTSATDNFQIKIDKQAKDLYATVVFYMMTSVPEQYILMEKVKVTETEGLYYVDHVSAWDNYLIETAQEYREAYGEGGICDGYNVGYDISFYRQILEHLINHTNPSFYARFTDPVSAAKELLHLGGGTGEVTQWDKKLVQSVENHIVEIPDEDRAMSMAGEGSCATVTYTFAKDGSSVEIRMELIEESQGIWGLQYGNTGT